MVRHAGTSGGGPKVPTSRPCPGRANPGRRSLAPSERGSDDRDVDEIIRQCPFCPLRFAYHQEVKDHILHDHPDHAAAFVGIELHELPQE